ALQLIPPKESMGWLGVHLDTRLSFKKHVEVMTGKALKGSKFPKVPQQDNQGIPARRSDHGCKRVRFPGAHVRSGRLVARRDQTMP
ncbi:hypothetical protein CI102_14188, partial [Trichoderma harzianum]